MLAQVLLDQGNAEDAEPLIRDYLTLCENFHLEQHPLFSIVKRKLAVSLALQGKWDEAYEARTGIRTNGISPEFLDRWVCREVVRALLHHKGREQEALPVVEGMRSRLHTLQTERGLNDDQTLSLAFMLVEMYAGVGQEENAERLLEEAGTNYMAALKEGMSVNPERMNELAWDLVSKADPRLRAPQFALELATRAVDAEPIDGDYWNTLGVACYRTGNYAEAVKALDKATGLQAKGHRFDGFFMAMAQYQLGHRQEALRWYSESVEWMKRNGPRPEDEDRLRFQAEAAELLGIEDAEVGD